MRTFRGLVTMLLVLLGLVLALPGNALAANSVRTVNTFSNDFAFSGCGPTVNLHEDAKAIDTLKTSDALDANGLPTILSSFQFHSSGTISGNGKTLTFGRDLNVTDRKLVYNGPETVQLPDGSIRTGASYSFHEAINGTPWRIKLANGRVVSVDAGRIDYDMTVVVFTDIDGVVTARSEDHIAGPHPLYPDGSFCQLLQQQFG